MEVVVIGAGLSGLFQAYFLHKRGLKPILYESSGRVGGMVQTLELPFGHVEAAANAILNTHTLEELADDIGVKIIPTLPTAKKRYIFRQGLKRWPLSFFESLLTIWNFFWSSKKPMPRESIKDWCFRTGGRAFHDRLVEPALRGIYAGSSERLSATLLLSRFFRKGPKTKKPILRGSVSFKGGLEELAGGLESYLKKNGVKIKLNTPLDSLEPFKANPVIICTNAPSAARLFKATHPETASFLSKIEMVPIATVNLFFLKHPKQIDAFGVLFPKIEEFKSLGVLFENCLFENRSDHRNERWIVGGVQNSHLLSLPDQELLKMVLTDRSRMTIRSADTIECLLDVQVVRWPGAFPHYTLDLEEVLNHPSILKLEERNIYLGGNFSGGLGLKQILENARERSDKIAASEVKE